MSLIGGERGPKGDHGQPGHDGHDGPTGEVGLTGPPGAAGATLSRSQVLFGFFFVVAAFVLLAYLTQRTADDLQESDRRQEVQVYEQCRISADNAEALSLLIDQILTSLDARDDLDEATKATYKATYKAARPVVVDCGP